MRLFYNQIAGDNAMQLLLPAIFRSRATRAIVLALEILCLGTLPVLSQDVLTYHNDNFRDGLNAKETILTLGNVNLASFGKLFTIPVDGRVDAQPLYLSAVTISGVTSNLLIVATEHGSVYAFNADTGARIWQITTLKSGETTSDNRGCGQIGPEIGITSTPVISRPATSHPVIYVVAMSKDSSGNYDQRLHALDATNGAELFKGPVAIQAQYPGHGDNSQNGNVVFDPGQYKERASLLLVGNTVYLAWASHCDFRPYTGWIMGYNSQTLAQSVRLNLTPNGSEGAIWGSGAGMAADLWSNIFVLDANGTFDPTLNSSHFPVNGNYGNAFLKLSSSLTVIDYFEEYNQAQENGSDTDLGSGGALLTNQKDSTGILWNLAVGAGKDGNLYVVNRNNMGKFNSTSNQIYQELAGALPGGIWSTPAAFDANIYYAPVGSPLLAFQFKNAKLLSDPVARSSNSFPYPGAAPSISANGTQNAIVWAVQNANPAVLHAYNAVTLVHLYGSSQAANNRDHFGNGNKFVTPTIANGKVYVGTTNGVGVFGLLK
jgi:PQQ enzyme repeat